MSLGMQSTHYRCSLSGTFLLLLEKLAKVTMDCPKMLDILKATTRVVKKDFSTLPQLGMSSLAGKNKNTHSRNKIAMIPNE